MASAFGGCLFYACPLPNSLRELPLSPDSYRDGEGKGRGVKAALQFFPIPFACPSTPHF
jgi:hypothetical protein